MYIHQQLAPTGAQFEADNSARLFNYQALENGHIRLLSLSPGHADDELRCSLLPASLDEYPEYEAMSCCWDDPEPVHYIQCEGAYMQLTTNLASGLRQFRHTDSPRILWVDQICINQSDMHERSAQVKLMGNIFKQARQVLIWLGPDDEADPEAPLAISIIEKLVKLPKRDLRWDEQALQEHGLPPLSSPAWRAFSNLVKLPYFARVWVLQEISLAPRTVMLWGSTVLEIEQSSAFLRSVASLPEWEWCLTSADIVNFCVSMGERVQHLRSLLSLARVARSRKAKEPHDLIFALLGMLEGDTSQILIDYSKSLVEIYTSAVCYLINEFSHSLEFLSNAGTQRLVEPTQQWQTWPSWVPSFPAEHLASIWHERFSFRADGKEPRHVAQLHHEHRKLSVAGVHVATLSHVMRFQDHDKDIHRTASHRLRKAYDLLQAPRSGAIPPQVEENSLLPRLMRTLLCGSYYDIEHITITEEEAGPELVYKDFVDLVAYDALIDLEDGLLDNFQKLQDHLQIADQALVCAWLSERSNSLASDTSCEELSHPIVADIKQVYLHKSNYDSPKIQAFTDRSERTIAALDWPYEDKQESSKLIAYLIVVGGDADRFIGAIHTDNHHRVFFTTGPSLFGVGPPAVQPNDVVVILFGGQAPFILRPTSVDGEYHLIGDCYIDGIMHGEYVEKLKAEGIFEESKTTFTLV